MKAEWESSKLAHEATLAEFEGYKVWVMACFLCTRTRVPPLKGGGGRLLPQHWIILWYNQKFRINSFLGFVLWIKLRGKKTWKQSCRMLSKATKWRLSLLLHAASWYERVHQMCYLMGREGCPRFSQTLRQSVRWSSFGDPRGKKGKRRNHYYTCSKALSVFTFRNKCSTVRFVTLPFVLCEWDFVGGYICRYIRWSLR